MAKILVCADGFFRAFSPISLEPYIEMFIKSLVANGNHVMSYIGNDIIKKNKKFKSWYRQLYTYNEVKTFNPEIIFTFNNLIDERFLKNLDCKCYIIASDTPLYWHKKELLSKYKDKYRVLYFNNDFSNELEQIYKIDFKNQLQIPYTTDLKAYPENQDKDITFCGNFCTSQWYIIDNKLDLPLKSLEKFEIIFHEMIQTYKENHTINDGLYEQYYNLNKHKNIDKQQIEKALCLAFTNKTRIDLLSRISDLNLHIYTSKENFNIFNYDYDLFTKCHFQNICSAKDNEKIYNQSKIALSLPHFQAKTGFSWRVCDIMASNAMLLSNDNADLKKQFGNIIPTYKTSEELKKLCLYYLEHDDERIDIVNKAQEIINKKHRFINLLELLQQYTEIKLLNNETNGKLLNTTRTNYLQKKYLRKKGQND